MKTKQILLLATAILFWMVPCPAETTNTPLEGNIADYAKDTNIVWGVASHGVRSGLKVLLPGSEGKGYPLAPQCIMSFQNVGTNNVVFRVRYKAELHGPDGNPIKLNPGQEIPVHNQRKITGPRPMETDQIDFFSIPEVFQIRTNGIHQLIISMQAATNKWHGTLTYFDLPPVTNRFEISSSPKPLGLNSTRQP